MCLMEETSFTWTLKTTAERTVTQGSNFIFIIRSKT